ncbi:MAG: pectinesterase family protein [Armatimonadota bacterium]|nr:pectinesterase family protein [Armatimonadota bacterium]
MNKRTIRQNWQSIVSVAALLLGAGGAQAKTITVAADGSGDFKTVQEAIVAVPDNSAERTVIHLKPGTYQGQIILPKEKTNVSFEGEDVEKTVLTFSYNTNEENPPSVNQRYKGTGVVILGDDFRADKITFQNASGDHGQALALRIDGDRAIVHNCRLLGWQDTLMVNNGRQYFKDCYIEGRVDFIYGSGTAVFDNCQIHSKNGGYVTAASTPQEKPYGFVFLNCKLTGDPKPWIDPATGQPPAGRRADAKAYLGRPWRPYGNVAFINCQMGDHIRPEGWNNWGKVENEKTARYAEHGSRTLDAKLPDGTIIPGKPLDVSKRVPWARQLTTEEAAQYTLANIFGGWNPLSPTSAATPASAATPSAKTAPVAASAAGAQSAVLSAQRPAGIKVRIVLAGDSTVTGDGAGWGDGFKRQLKPEVELINLAKGGRSSGSFVAEGRWKQTLELKPDYVLIQFGHNDQPGHGPERETDPKTTYRANMERYVDEARAAGIKPILVTSLSRRQWGEDGKINSGLTPYVETVKQIAAEKQVPLIDLHALSIALYEKMGKEGVLEISPRKNADPNSKNSDTASAQNQGYDGTHLNAKGGEIVGRLVAEALRQAVPDLAPYLDLSEEHHE